MKTYCKLSGFLSKFSLREKVPINNHFVCVRSKNSIHLNKQLDKLYTV
jgi:hypothetical protein